MENRKKLREQKGKQKERQSKKEYKSRQHDQFKLA